VNFHKSKLCQVWWYCFLADSCLCALQAESKYFEKGGTYRLNVVICDYLLNCFQWVRRNSVEFIEYLQFKIYETSYIYLIGFSTTTTMVYCNRYQDYSQSCLLDLAQERKSPYLTQKKI